jgi:hypothetical protein
MLLSKIEEMTLDFSKQILIDIDKPMVTKAKG